MCRAGEPLIDGPINPHDILQVLGENELQRYLVDKIQEVYRSQSVNINDKHIEVIVRQMMRSVKIEEVGDTDFLIDEQVDRWRFQEENTRVAEAGGQPSIGRPMLQGITKASLSTQSFISAASFQETTRVLTEAAICGKVDSTARPEGKRHCRSSDSGRHRHGDVPRFPYGGDRIRGAGGVGGRSDLRLR